MKFHITEQGNPAECRAEVRQCPRGSAIDHYPTLKAAREAYESKNSTKVLKKERKVKTKLSDVVDLDLMNKMIDERDVTVNEHPQDKDLKILCYGKQVTRKGRWNDATKLARGLIIRSSQDDLSDAVIVQRPWGKFFTLQQVASGWSLGDEENDINVEDEMKKIDFDAKAEVTDKVDGSLGILYMAPDGKPALTTKASFKSEQGVYYTRMLRKNPEYLNATQQLLKKHPDVTFSFELTGADNRIVLKYDKDEITLLGAVRKNDGLYLGTDDYKESWGNLPITEKMPATTLREALELPDRENREGVVVRIISDDPKDQFMIKIKQDDYIQMHRVTSAYSAKRSRELVKSLEVKTNEWLEFEKTGDLASFSHFKNELFKNDMEEEGKEFMESKLASVSNTLMGEAKRIKKTLELVDSLSVSELSDQRELYKKYGRDDQYSQVLMWAAKNKVEGLPYDELNYKSLLRTISKEIKGK